ncbi:unnamed protein product [Gordionus sp. m RMFG-2023]
MVITRNQDLAGSGQPPDNLLTPDNSLSINPPDNTASLTQAILAISQQMQNMSTRMQAMEQAHRERSPSRSNMTSTPYVPPRSRLPSPAPAPPILPPRPPPIPLTIEEKVAKLQRNWAGVCTDLLEPRCKASERDRHELKHIKEVVDQITIDTEPGIVDSMTKRVRILGLAIHWGWDTARFNDMSYQEKFLDSEEIKLARDPFRARARAGPSTSYQRRPARKETTATRGKKRK